MNAKISVAMAAFRGGRFLESQLESIVAQTRLPDELVICDDASPDDTVAIAERFSVAAPFPVTIFRRPANVGVLENFYSAFALTTGDIIFYCDQDDVWAPDKVARMIGPFRDPEVQLSLHRSLVVDEELKGEEMIPTNPRYGSIDFPLDPLSLYGFGHQMAFRRRVLDLMVELQPEVSAGATGLRNNFDAWIPFCASAIGAVHILPDPLIYFRRHGDTTSPLARETAARASTIQRLVATAATLTIEVEERARLIERADELGLLEQPRVERLRLAYRRRIAVATATSHVASGALPVRLFRVLRAAVEVLRPRAGFSNDRRSRELALAAAALARGSA